MKGNRYLQLQKEILQGKYEKEFEIRMELTGARMLGEITAEESCRLRQMYMKWNEELTKRTRGG